MTAMEIESSANPRIRAAAALRERRERDRFGTDARGWASRVHPGPGSRSHHGARARLSHAPRGRRRSRGGRRWSGRRCAAGPDPPPRTWHRDGRGQRAGVQSRWPSAIARTGSCSSCGPPATSPRCAFRRAADPLVVVTEDVEKPGNLGAILRSADGAGADAVDRGRRHGPVQSERRSGRASARSSACRSRRRLPPTSCDGCEQQASGSWPPGSTPRGSTSRRTSPVRSRWCSAARRRACPSAWRRARRRRRPPADARRRRQPQRLGCRRRPAVRGLPPARRPADRQVTDGRVRLRHHRGGAGRRSGGQRGPATGRDGRDRRSPVVRRQLPAHRLHPVEVAARFRRAPRAKPRHVVVAADLGAARLDGQPAARRRGAGRFLSREGPRGCRRRRLSRRGTDHGARPRRGPPRRCRSRRPRPERRDRRRLAGRGCRRSRASTRSRSGRTARRPSPASCRRACSSSAAGRPAASSPRSTPDSASPVTIVQSGDRLVPTDHPRNSQVVAEALRDDGVKVRLGVRAVAARAGAGDDGAHVDRPRRRHDRRGPRRPARRRPGVPARRPRARALRRSTRPAGTPFPRDGRLRIADGLWVIGDPAGPELHTHQAHYQGELAVRMALGEPVAPDYRALPRATYTDPEAAFVGMSAEQAKAEGIDAVELMADFATSTRGYAVQAKRGHVTIVVDRGTRTLVGPRWPAPTPRRRSTNACSRFAPACRSTSSPTPSTPSRRRGGSSTACSPKPDASSRPSAPRSASPPTSTRRGRTAANAAPRPSASRGAAGRTIRSARAPGISRPPSGSRVSSAGPTVAARSASSRVSASPGPNGGILPPRGSRRSTARAIPGHGSTGSTGASVPNASTAPASGASDEA